MSDEQKFEAFKRRAVEENEARYGAEIREKYGDEEAERASRDILDLTPERYQSWKDTGEAIQRKLEEAVRSGADPAGEAGRALAELHRAWLSFGSSPYDPARHRGLAELYVQDERFTAYYDKSVPGCARFLRDAVLSHVPAAE